MVSDSVASRVRRVAAGEVGGDAERGEVGDVAELTAFVVDQVLGHEHGQRQGEEPDGEDRGDQHDGDDLSAHCSPSVPRHGRITACPATV